MGWEVPKNSEKLGQELRTKTDDEIVPSKAKITQLCDLLEQVGLNRVGGGICS